MNRQERKEFVQRNKQQRQALVQKAEQARHLGDAELVCPRCQVKGSVRTIKMLWETFAECQNCHTPRWSLNKSMR